MKTGQTPSRFFLAIAIDLPKALENTNSPIEIANFKE